MNFLYYVSLPACTPSAHPPFAATIDSTVQHVERRTNMLILEPMYMNMLLQTGDDPGISQEQNT